jgi:uncharacterized membrane protein YfcA
VEILVLVFSGIIGGLIAGLLGLGGGVFNILILPYVLEWFGVPREISTPFVVANSLFGIAFASATSLISEYKNLVLYWKEGLFLGVPAVVASLLSTHYIVQSEWFSVKVFNVFVIFLMLFILSQLLLKRNIQETNQKLSFLPISTSGALAGFISALSGLGGGIIIIPLLQIKFKQCLRKAKLISLIVIFLSSTFMTFLNLLSKATPLENISYQFGFILPGIAIPIVLGVFIGSPLGVKLSYKMADQYIKILFSLFVVLVLIEKLMFFF